MRRALGASLIALLIVPGARPAVAHDLITTKVTFAREIRAIVAARCVSCHITGGSAPMPLTTYEEVRPWARAIKDQVLTRRMPTWHAARGYGAFRNDPTLTPLEMVLVVSWVDGGLPRGGPEGAGGARGAGAKAAGAHGDGARGAGARGTVAVVLPPGAAQASGRLRSRWVSGWSFEPGDPLITSATITSDGGPVGTWTAGDEAIALPRGMAVRVWGPVRIEVRRRIKTDYEQPFTARRSVLRFTTRTGRPRRVWTEAVHCGAPRTGRPAELLAVRPLLEPGASARIWLERTGAPQTVMGWFRDFDPAYARSYWLSRPADLPLEARLQGDAACRLELTLVARR